MLASSLLKQTKTLGFVWILAAASAQAALVTNAKDCEGPLKALRAQLEKDYLANSRKNATAPENIKASDSATSFGLNSSLAESSSAKEALARLAGLEKFLKKQADPKTASADLRVLMAVGATEIKEALAKVEGQSSGAANRFEDWNDGSTDTSSSDGFHISIMGMEFPSKVLGIPIPRVFLGKMFGVWIFPGPLAFGLTGVDVMLREVLSKPMLSQFINEHLGATAMGYYNGWVLPNAPQVAMTAGILLCATLVKFGFKNPATLYHRVVSRIRGAVGFDDDAADEPEEKPLVPVAAQFNLFMDALKKPATPVATGSAVNGGGPRYFAASYFDSKSVPADDEADEDSPNREIDMMHFNREDGTPVLMVFDRKIQ